jgi:hypothetical protein
LPPAFEVGETYILSWDEALTHKKIKNERTRCFIDGTLQKFVQQ